MMETPEKGTMEYGAYNALVNALKVQSGEIVTVVTDEDTSDIGSAFYSMAMNLDARPRFFCIEDYGDRPILDVPAEIIEAAENSNVTLYIAGVREGELSFRKAFIGAALGSGARHGHGVGVNKKIMLSGMQADIPEANRLCREMYDRLNDVPWIRVKTDAGTDMLMEFDSKYRWVNSDWTFTPGKMHNLPSGEVFTHPRTARGSYVVDGVLGDFFDKKYGSLEGNPVTYVVKDGRVTDIQCDNSDLKRELRKYVFDNVNGDVIGEVGIGALETELVYMMLQDEKKRGTVHIAHGDALSQFTGAPDYGCKNHCDGVMLNATLETPRGFILKKGVYQPV